MSFNFLNVSLPLFDLHKIVTHGDILLHHFRYLLTENNLFLVLAHISGPVFQYIFMHQMFFIHMIFEVWCIN